MSIFFVKSQRLHLKDCRLMGSIKQHAHHVAAWLGNHPELHRLQHRRSLCQQVNAAVTATEAVTTVNRSSCESVTSVVASESIIATDYDGMTEA